MINLKILFYINDVLMTWKQLVDYGKKIKTLILR